MVYSHRALGATFSALADPTRRDILARLAAGDRTIGELASRFTMSLPAVSKHVRVLQRAGLATVEKEGRVRRATLHAAPMRDVLAWVERYRHFWETELDLLAAYLENPQPTDDPWPKQQPPKTPRRPPSKSAARSARRGSASTTRGRKRKS